MVVSPSSAPARHWHVLDDGRIQCDVCPRHCKLAVGQRGLCFVRAREEDHLELTTWGRSSGYCVDPIEKKPLNHFLPGTPVLSFGTAGCNLTCRYCQNWDISKSRELDTLADEAPPEKIAQAAVATGSRSVAFTYNDPVIFLEYAVDTAIACHERDVRTVAVTAGWVDPDARADFFAHVDAANVDLKAFRDDFYRNVCGASLAPVLDTLVYLREETDVWLELTTLLIPGQNDGDEELHDAAAWIGEHLGPDVPWHLTAFHPDYRMRDVGPTPLSVLERARGIARSYGLRYVYTGNVRDLEGGTTRCHACGEALIVRDGYEISGWSLDADAACAACGTACAGIFEARPGDWGSRRMPIRLAELGG
ncbi:MAG: AmmeMemoRadiSam system radical SAM enzyme [bacterium]|nr:AmmeMemoRadiSam system radical SAM enzyme [bacterium]